MFSLFSISSNITNVSVLFIPCKFLRSFVIILFNSSISLMRFLKENNKIRLDVKFIELLGYEEMEDIKEHGIIHLREDYTYGVQISVKDEAKINELKKICKEFIDITKEIIYK